MVFRQDIQLNKKLFPVPEILVFLIGAKSTSGDFFYIPLKREQFARHASNKLRHSVEYTSSKCSTQVENELKDTFARLEFTAKEVTDDIDDKIQLLDGIKNLKKSLKKIFF